MNIIILNGSPRQNGNTANLCDSFISGARSAGHMVTRFDLQQMDIHGCLGCMTGGKDPASPCVQKDDMDNIYPPYMEADIVVLASPIYFWSISSQLSAAFDRLFAVAEMDSKYKSPHKRCILLLACENGDPNHWKPILDYYHARLGHLGWEDTGTVTAGGVLNVGDIKGHPALEEARLLGASLC